MRRRRRCSDLSVGGSGRARKILLLLGVVLVSCFPAASQDSEAEQFFETKIRPLLIEKCSACHGEKVRMADLDLTTAEGLRAGAGGKPVVSADDPAMGALMRAVRHEDKVKMPPTGKLHPAEIAALGRWVEMGTPWPKPPVVSGGIVSDDSSPENKGKSEPDDPTETDHWSFQPIRDPKPPAVRDTGWVKTDIDAFILARLERKGLTPVPPADKLTLLRRVKLDLLGLLPTLDEIERFTTDSSPRAFADLVDRLLDSPHYGEHWGRRWLDVARYADSTGVDEDKPYVHAWRYRDYVIDAFRRDLPYDQFVREQIAGDLLPPPPGQSVNLRGITATGFLALGPKALAQQDKVQMVYDVVDEQIDTTSKAFLGLTISCSRCHDHKFDPILTTDYYSLASIFASTRSYEDPQAFVSRFIVTPLIRKDLGERYLDEQEKIKGTKRAINTIVGMGVIDDGLRNAVPLLADSMLAARRVYEDGLAVETVARDAGLDVERLSKWVEYLRPGAEPKVHLEKWHAAGAADRAAAAKQYQRLYAEVARERMAGTDEWLTNNLRDMIEGKSTRFLGLQKLRRDPFHTEVSEGPLAAADDEEDEHEKLLSAKWKKRLEPLQARVKRLEAEALSEPPMACAVSEGEPVTQPVFVRGRHDNHGPIVAKQFPIVLAGRGQQPVREGSGRRELAEFLTREDNPLPARVMVNRIWLGHFGEGLVRTPNNFGIVGEPPTHPDLLDYLARRFVESGWSVKHVHRLIVLSSTYQMSTRVSDEAWQGDSANRLWSRFNRRRLTIEELRDNYLALSGKLDLTVGGNVEPESAGYTEFERNNRLVDPDFTMRRSLYLPLHRNKLPSLFNLFDFGDATTSNGKRSQTSVAPQALYLMNSRFSNVRSREFAERLLAEGGDVGESELIERAYSMALTRPPSPEERTTAMRFLTRFGHEQTSAEDARLAAWKSFCKMLTASNEFHYID